MFLEQLTARQFRNLNEVDLCWGPGFNIIWGNNAQGKTNLLEAVYLLGHLKSFRGARTAELIQEGMTAARLTGRLVSREVRHRLEVSLEPHGQTPRLDDKPVQKLSQFLGTLRPVLFTADELVLLKGAPAGRRALLDRAVLQADPGYLDRFHAYSRVLRQRNQLLKERAAPALLEPWNEALIENGARIRHDRQVFLAGLQQVLSGIGRDIADSSEQLSFGYPHAGAPDQLQAGLRREQEQLLARERQLGQTLAGPHRDDPEPLIDGRPLKLFGSQGQNRSFLLAFKAAQLIDLERRLGEPPLLLLDDLASELDAGRQASFFAFLRRRRGQVLITTTHPATLGEAVCPQARYFRVEQGRVEERQAI
ncbi:MAG: DNA replication and repair protein RecF [Deltaproteobacteria bacterium]|nr:MAG: DNA replication and repair protein RecF [Deltaproteobacteria bacterium]